MRIQVAATKYHRGRGWSSSGKSLGGQVVKESSLVGDWRDVSCSLDGPVSCFLDGAEVRLEGVSTDFHLDPLCYCVVGLAFQIKIGVYESREY